MKPNIETIKIENIESSLKVERHDTTMKASYRPSHRRPLKQWLYGYIIIVVLFHSAIYKKRDETILETVPAAVVVPTVPSDVVPRVETALINDVVAQQSLRVHSLNVTRDYRDDNQPTSSSSSSSSSSTPKMAKYLDDVWHKTVQLIYRDTPKLDFYLSRAPPLVYVYDTLDSEFSVESVAKCMEDTSIKSGIHDSCGYYPRVCNSTAQQSNNGALKRIRNNFNSDVVLTRLFREYPYQTKDPSKADVFVVPYPHRSHCFCKADSIRCPYNFKFIEANILDKLTHLNQEQNLDRHLFLFGSDFLLSNPPFRRFTKLHFSLGPADGCRATRYAEGKHWSELCGSFTTPYVNLDPAYQPNKVTKLISDPSKNKDRKYALAAIMSTQSHMDARVEFFKNYKRWLPQDGKIGGLPMYVQNLAARQMAVDTLEIYQQSMFCLVLAGDDCSQRRFFDVLMSGCIPVVLEFIDSDEDSWSSWFRSGRCSRRRVYPFSRGVYHREMQAGIDYESSVVRIKHLYDIQAELEDVLANATRLTLLRKSMALYAPLWTYGLEEKPSNTHQHVDAFSGLMVTLRHYLDFL